MKKVDDKFKYLKKKIKKTKEKIMEEQTLTIAKLEKKLSALENTNNLLLQKFREVNVEVDQNILREVLDTEEELTHCNSCAFFFFSHTHRHTHTAKKVSTFVL